MIQQEASYANSKKVKKVSHFRICIAFSTEFESKEVNFFILIVHGYNEEADFNRMRPKVIIAYLNVFIR